MICLQATWSLRMKMRSCDDHFTQSNLLTEDIMVLDTHTYCFREFWYHVNGLCFDRAGVLCRELDGAPLNAPPIVKAIAKDPVLSKWKIIAEPWDYGGLYLVGNFPSCDNGGTGSGFFFKGERMLSKHFMRRMQTSAVQRKNTLWARNTCRECYSWLLTARDYVFYLRSALWGITTILVDNLWQFTNILL